MSAAFNQNLKATNKAGAAIRKGEAVAKVVLSGLIVPHTEAAGQQFVGVAERACASGDFCTYIYHGWAQIIIEDGESVQGGDYLGVSGGDGGAFSAAASTARAYGFLEPHNPTSTTSGAIQTVVGDSVTYHNAYINPMPIVVP